jgi:hypothetical protein
LLSAGRLLLVRLRFPLVLLIALVVVGQWDTLRNYFSKLTRSRQAVSSNVAADIEFWCPMCPGVVSEWPSKCPVCNMTLVQRKRGDATPLPSGVVARMQLSPYRMQLAGIQTSAVGFRSLLKEVRLAGLVEQDDRLWSRIIGDSSKVTARAEVFEKDLPFLKPGQKIELAAEAFPGHAAWKGAVGEIRASAEGTVRTWSALFRIDDPKHELRPGMQVAAKVEFPVADLEPFRSMKRGTPPTRSEDQRKFYFCPDHPEVLRQEPGRCPHDNQELHTGLMAANQELGWCCPMHVHVTADQPGASCAECQGMQLGPRIVTYSPAGEVLAVPHSAVLDTGRKKMVYVERMPGMFDGVEVVVGPRCGDFYPVIAGLEPGQRVVATGAFLIDAETRLNPNIAVGYFGAAQASPSPRGRPPKAEPARKESPAKTILPDVLKLPPADRDLAVRQDICPVTDEPLGSMGVPVKVIVEGKAVFLCCKGCERELRANAKKYLARLAQKQASQAKGRSESPVVAP